MVQIIKVIIKKLRVKFDILAAGTTTVLHLKTDTKTTKMSDEKERSFPETALTT